MNTFLVFTDLPIHVEYRVEDWPLVYKGLEIIFKINLVNPRDVKKVRKINGKYKIISHKLMYSNDKSFASGLSQYIELDFVK